MLKSLLSVLSLAQIITIALSSPLSLSPRAFVPQNVTGATLQTLKDHSKLAMAAYGNPAGCQTTFLGSTILQQFNSTLGQVGYIIQIPSRKEVVIVFRGSASFDNLASNLNIAEVPVTWAGCDGCTAIKGSVDNYYDAKNYTNNFQAANAAIAQGYKLVVVGHSLGGAVATVAAGDLGSEGRTKTFTTCGEFRTLNAAGADYIDKMFGTGGSRLLHAQDPVPGLIPLSENNRHHGTAYHIAGDLLTPVFQTCDGDEDPVCSNGNLADAMTALEDHLYYYSPIFFCGLLP